MAISRVAYTEGTSNLGGTPSIVNEPVAFLAVPC